MDTSTILDAGVTVAGVANDTSCPTFDGDTTKCNILKGVRITVATLSMIGSLFIIALIWIFKKYAVLTQRLVLYLSIAAFSLSLAFIIADIHPDGPTCTFKAWAMSITGYAVILWVCCITFNLYMNAVLMKTMDHLELIYHVFVWGVSFIVSLIPIFGDAYGPAEMWCWVKDDWRWRFGTWYIPLFIIIFLLFVVYTYIIIMVQRKAKTWEGHHNPDIERQKKMLAEDVKPLLAYPCIYLVLSIFPLINRIQNAVSDDASFGLMLLQVICSPLNGAAYAIAFGLDKETRTRLNFANIKVAIMNRYRGDTLVREYPVFSDESDQYQPTPTATPPSTPDDTQTNYLHHTGQIQD